MPPISGLWDEAYNQLKSSKPQLILDYEALLPVQSVAQGRAERYQQLQGFISGRIDEIEKGAWKIRFKDHQFLVKDFVEPVVGVVACTLRLPLHR